MTENAPISTEIVFVDGDDWQGVYLNGELVAEEHRLFDRPALVEQIFTMIPGVVFSSHPKQELIGEYLYERGNLPSTLTELSEDLESFVPSDD